MKPASEWEETIVLTSSMGIEHVRRLNVATIRAIQADAIRWAAAQKPRPMNELDTGLLGEGFNDGCDAFEKAILKGLEK